MTTDTDRAHLITVGLTPRLHGIVAGLGATHVDVDMTADDVDPGRVLLGVVDAALPHPRVVVAVGPLVFGWVCAGRFSDLAGWARLRGPDSVELAVCPDETERESYGMSSEVYTRLGADVGLMLNYVQGLDWLVTRTQGSDDEEAGRG